MAGTATPPPGRARPTGMKAVAERAGVAISSVSRVLSGHPDVSDAMKDRVLGAVADLGYEPDMLAQSLRTGETRSIGFVVSDIANPVFALMAHGAELELASHGYSVLLASSLNDDRVALQQIRRMHQRRVDGLIVSAGEERDGPISEHLRRSTIPTVLVDRRLSVPDASHVYSAHRLGVAQAAEHLLALGHRRIALINGQPEVLPAAARARAMQQAVAGVDGVELTVSSGTFSEEHGRAAMIALMAGDEPPTAVVAGGNQLLVGVLRAIRELGLRVPRDVSLVTCDPLPLAEFLDPALSVVWRDARQLGVRAARALLARLDGEAARDVRLPTDFRAAGSSAAPRDGGIPARAASAARGLL